MLATFLRSQVQLVRELLRGTTHALIGGSYQANYLAALIESHLANELIRRSS